MEKRSKKTRSESSTTPTIDENQRCCWSSLPIDPLTMILRCLSFLDHLSFGAVCKQWRLTSKNCPVQYQYGRSGSAHPLNWLMLWRKSTATNGGNTSTSIWEFGDPSTGRMYKIDIPELCRKSTRFVLSKHGWLLVFSSEPSPSLFFFNPFSKARIDLPWSTDFYRMKRMLNVRHRWSTIYEDIPVFAVSAPPTSPHCVVYAITYIDEDNFRISVCRHGDTNWTARTNDKIPRIKFAPIRNAMVHAGIFYWVDKKGQVRAFRETNQGDKYRRFEIAKASSKDKVCSYLVDSLGDGSDGKVLMCLDFPYTRKRQVITLLEDIDDPIDQIQNIDKYRLNLRRDGYENPGPSWLRLDSFPVGFWCLSSSASASDSGDIDGAPKFCNWHVLEADYRACPNNCGGFLGYSVWIEPKWIEPSQAIAWST